jgi:hypothetical protein
MEQNHVSAEIIADVLEIPMDDLLVGKAGSLDSDDFLRACAYLHLRPEKLLLAF